MISTRRFEARPAAVSFVATGLSSPKPLAWTIDPSTPPRVTNQVRTALDRRSDSSWFEALLPTESVCPST
jgi:hypothetical protein